MVVVEICMSQAQVALFSSNKQIDVTITSDQEKPEKAVEEAFKTLDLVLQRKLFLER